VPAGFLHLADAANQLRQPLERIEAVLFLSAIALRDSRITAEGVVVIKAQRYRTQEQNRLDALERLAELIRSVGKVEKARRPTKPTLGSKTRRLEGKSRRGAIKAGRGRIDY